MEGSDLVQNKKKIKGFLNRLSESTLDYISDQIITIIKRSNSTKTCQIFSEEITNCICTNIVLLENFSLLYAALVYLTIHELDSKKGKYLIASFILKYEKIKKDCLSTNSASEEENLRKMASNAIKFLCYLYNFQILSAGILYELIRELTLNLSMLSVELLLKLLLAAGYQLKMDDSSALKEILILFESEKKNHSQLDSNSRFRFMVDVLQDLKNNKKKLVKDSNALILQWKTTLGIKLKKKAVPKKPPVDFLLKEILEPEAFSDKEPLPSTEPSSATSSYESLLQEKIQEQRLNTDIRKIIFRVLMSSDNYVEAFNSLVNLKLKNKQSREIPKVIVHCCVHEKTYNPYYAFLSHLLNQSDKTHTKTFMYLLWDYVKSLQANPDTSVQKSGSSKLIAAKLLNMSKFYAFLICKGDLALSCLKIAQFETVQRNVSLNVFLSLLVARVFIGYESQDALLKNIAYIIKSQKLDLFKESFEYFCNRLGKTHQKDLGSSTFSIQEQELLKERLDLAHELFSQALVITNDQQNAKRKRPASERYHKETTFRQETFPQDELDSDT